MQLLLRNGVGSLLIAVDMASAFPSSGLEVEYTIKCRHALSTHCSNLESGLSAKRRGVDVIRE
jgi:hypothetical protein